MVSDFLCGCGRLIYFDVKTKKEYCISKDCKNFKDILIIRDRRDEAENKFQSMKSSLKLKSKLFHPEFIRFLFAQQNYLFYQLYSGKGVKLKEFLNINYLIFLTKDIKFIGRDNRQKSFSNFLEKQNSFLEPYLFYQDVKEKNIVLADFSDRKAYPLILKYLNEINKQRNNYGLISDMESSQNFKYEDIDTARLEKDAIHFGQELDKYFVRFFREMIKIDMLTKSNNEFSKMFNRQIDKYFIAGLLSLFFSSGYHDSLSSISKQNFSKTLRKMDFDDEKIETFFNLLSGDNNQIPLAIINSDNVIYGKWTIFAMALKYLGGLPEKSLIKEGKVTASAVFEEKIRELMRKKGYIVPFEKNIEIPKGSFDYDVIAINDKNKEIYIIEAKYHDLPNSAFSGENLIHVKINDEETGEKSISERHIKRKENLEKNKGIFNKKLLEKGLKIKLDEYGIYPYVIFKFKPILNNFNEVKLLGFDDINVFFP